LKIFRNFDLLLRLVHPTMLSGLNRCPLFVLSLSLRSPLALIFDPESKRSTMTVASASASVCAAVSTDDGFTVVTSSRRRCFDRTPFRVATANRFAALSADSDSESSSGDEFVEDFAQLAADITADLRRSLQFRRWLFSLLQSKSSQFARFGLALANYEFVCGD
jgi:hypothetical protein